MEITEKPRKSTYTTQSVNFEFTTLKFGVYKLEIGGFNLNILSLQTHYFEVLDIAWLPSALLGYRERCESQSDTTELTQSHHNCVDTWACGRANATKPVYFVYNDFALSKQPLYESLIHC